MSDMPRVNTMQQRFDAVQRALTEIRTLATHKVPSRETLQRVQHVLVELACRSELFPADGFAVHPGRQGSLYELSVDEDLRYALYASAGAPGKYQPPHNHTTWAVIAGVFGNEHNVRYERTDDGSVAGQGVLEPRGELTVRRGNGIAFQGNDFHTIAVDDSGASLHLHLYGLSLEHLPDRIGFADMTGGASQRFMAKPELFAPRIGVAELRAQLADGAELALLDVREGGVYAQAHLLTAGSLPLSSLELRVPDLLPRKSVRIVLVDDDEIMAQAAGRILRRHGYHNLAVLKGGVGAWREAGHELFSGVYVPSKAFGEFVEHQYDTPRVEAATLAEWQEQGRDVLVLDSRPMNEYQIMSIPGAADCPGAELVYRAPALLKSPDTVVVVNCAGRTRSIIGAQSLINAGLPNQVFALKDGTMGWHLSGRDVARGKHNIAPPPSGDGLQRARQLAAQVAERFAIGSIAPDQLEVFMRDSARTTYLFDVRLPDDYAAGHHADALSAPGGQLVQSTDAYAAVRNARVVLVDKDGVQAVMTAHWLKQMGWRDVFVLSEGLTIKMTTGKVRKSGLSEDRLTAPAIGVAQLRTAVEAGAATVVDVGDSLRYRRGHIPGAWYAIRSRLPACLARFAAGTKLVFISSDGRLARYAADDAHALGYSTMYLAGGTDAWTQAGVATTAASGDDDPHFLTTTDDAWYPPYARNSGVEEAMQQYLTWEVNLVQQMQGETYLRFSTQPG